MKNDKRKKERDFTLETDENAGVSEEESGAQKSHEEAVREDVASMDPERGRGEGDPRNSPRTDKEPLNQPDEDLEEMLDRERLGSGEYDHEERMGRNDVKPDRKRKDAGDEGES